MLAQLLARVEQEYAEEYARVEATLAECGHEHVTPGKDYWHRKVHLERKLKLLRELKELLDEPPSPGNPV